MIDDKHVSANNPTRSNLNRRFYITRKLHCGEFASEYVFGSLQDVDRLLREKDGTILSISFKSRESLEQEGE